MRIARPGALLLGLLAAGILSVPQSRAEVTLTDAGGRSVRVADASRVLSIGGDITEIVYALGAEARLVAVDSTSQFPPQALKDKQNVGYMRALSTEGVISVNATLIIATERSGPPEVVKSLKSASAAYVEVPDSYSLQGIASKVRLVAKAVGEEAAGERVVQQVEADFKALADGTAAIKRPLKAMFVLAVQNGRATVGGEGTAANAIIELAGAKNAAASVSGYKPVTDEAIVELAPDIIVTMRRSSDNDGHDTAPLLELKGVQSTPAGAAKRIVAMDGLYLLGFGPRAPRAARELMGLMYPDLAAGSTGR